MAWAGHVGCLLRVNPLGVSGYWGIVGVGLLRVILPWALYVLLLPCWALLTWTCLMTKFSMLSCLTCSSKYVSINHSLSTPNQKGTFALASKFWRSPRRTLHDLVGHLPVFFKEKTRNEIFLDLGVFCLSTLSDSPFGGLTSSSHVSVVFSDGNASLVVKDLLEVALGVFDFHSLQDVRGVDGVLVVNSQLVS